MLERSWHEMLDALAVLLGASDFPRRDVRLDRPVQAQPPVVAQFTSALALGSAPMQRVCAALLNLRDVLTWRCNESYADAALLERYAYCELVGTAGIARSDAFALGLLLLGPDVTYPPHRHPARETYVVLAGGAWWQQGDGVWREHPPGHRIEHASMEPHAMRTDGTPLLAAYLWHDHLHEGARLIAPST